MGAFPCPLNHRDHGPGDFPCILQDTVHEKGLSFHRTSYDDDKRQYKITTELYSAAQHTSIVQ